MAPGRRRGAKGLKTTNELSLGDLVLAKVKGFPAWPAKISRPEDWERAPDPKKYFVQFYGTSEIAFVAPADIQEFTLEAKNKLAARCKGKTVKFFAQAVKEISEEFEKLQQKNLNCLEDETSENAGPEEPSADVVVDDAMEVDLKDGNGTEGLHQEFSAKDVAGHGSTLERCSQRQEMKSCEDVKLCISGDESANLSPGTNAEKISELRTDGTGTDRPLEECTCDKKVKIDGTLAEHPRKVHIESCSAGGSSPVMPLDHVKNADNEHKELTNGRKPKLLTASKKKSEGQSEVHNVVGTVQLPSARDSSIRGVKPSVSGAQAVDGLRNKTALDFNKQSSSDMDDNSGKKAKKVPKDKHYFDTVDDHMDIKTNSGEQDQSRKKKNVQHGREKQTFRHNEVSPPAKRSKLSEMSDDSAKLSLQTSRKVGLKFHDGKVACEEIKRSAPRGKMENHLTSGLQASTVGSSISHDEDVLPPLKRRRRAVEAMSNSTLTPENQVRKAPIANKNDLSGSDSRRSSATAPTKRRAVRLCDDDDEEATKTPVHGGFANKVLTVGQAVVKSKKTDATREASAPGQTIMKKTSVLESGSGKELAPAMERSVGDASPNSQQDVEKKLRETEDTIVCSPCSLFSENASSKEGSPLRSPASVPATKAMPETQTASRDSTKVPSSSDVKKTPAGQDNEVGVADSFNSSLNKPASAKSMRDSSVERKKTTPKLDFRFEEDTVPPLRSLVGVNSSPSERPEAGREDKISTPADIKISDPVISMKNLIAVAQAKRRQAHLQNSHANPISFMTLNVEATMGSHSPASPVQLLGSYNNLRPEILGFQSHSSLASPSSDVRQPSTTYQHESEHFEEKRLSSSNLGAVGSLSGDTEAAVARDAFEGMIETLSRTKESIGRATRLAIDCAKYGIANEVIELLIRKLESEPSFHRKVDLFFLVDSITQCSHSHKGIAGAAYIPIVQAALPRLLGAAAPHGAAAYENRRQCLKVLRLWLERKILPESLVRPHMDEIRMANDDISSGFSFRRPTRSERAIDDPIREMEGMLVDEYGSNATFQLPGLFSSHGFEDDDEEEEDNPSSTSKEVVERSPAEHTPASRDPENCIATPNERRHCVLEDVDGELEMEDVSGHLKEERQSYVEGVSEVGPSYLGSEKILESAPNNPNIIIELPPLPEGSPPLPPDSPPQTPPLPSSPPPTSPPPPPPPPSPSPPPPPPPPPPPISQSHPFPPPPMGPPLAVLPQPLFPPQTSMGPQCLHPLPPSVPPPSPVVYQKTSVQQEMGMASGKQPAQMVSSAVHGLHGDVSSRSDIYPQKSPCFAPVGVGNSRETSGYTPSKPLEYGQNDAYVNAQVPQPNQQFQVVNAPYVQRPLHPNALAQNPSNHFSYTKPAVQQHPPHPQHPYPPPYSLPNLPEAPRQYLTDEQWRPRPVEFQNDYHQNSWIGAGSSYSGPPFVQEGNFRPPPERPPTNTFGFQPTLSGPSSGASVPSHGISGRTEMPSLSWRPV